MEAKVETSYVYDDAVCSHDFTGRLLCLLEFVISEDEFEI